MTLKIGKLELKHNIVAAPLAGYSDYAWRQVAVRFGAGLVFSEMLSVGTILYTKNRWERYVLNGDNARPFALQLFGSKPEWFLKSVEIIKDSDFDLLDINMGCPVKKVVSQGAGSALMKTPKLVAEILQAIRKEYDGPLSVKIRAGWDKESINAVEIATIAESEGADVITIHPRTRSQMFKEKADWSLIGDVKSAVKIPVIGNGDLTDRQGIEKMFQMTGCDGVMIGRAALGRPWLFNIDTADDVPTDSELYDIVADHLQRIDAMGDERYLMHMMKKFINRYYKGRPHVKAITRMFYEAQSRKEILDSLHSLKNFQNLLFRGFLVGEIPITLDRQPSTASIKTRPLLWIE